MRTPLTLILVTGLALSLSACASGTATPDATSASADCTPAAAGKASNAVKVTGDFGTKPTVDITTPTTATATERTVVIEGDGDQAVQGDKLNVEFTIYNGTDGKELSATDYAESPTQFTVDETKFLAGIAKTLDCSTVGSRVVGVIPPVDSWGDAGNTDLGVAATDTLVFVADVVSILPPVPARADGVDQDPVDGFPTVTLAEDGTPSVTIPKADPPKKLAIEVLKKGDGDKVAAGATVTVHYVGVNWTTGETFDSSWGRGEPTDFATTAVIAGFGDGLVDQTVGSQVVIVIPPDQGYGETGNADAGIGADDTLVFVVDILAVN